MSQIKLLLILLFGLLLSVYFFERTAALANEGEPKQIHNGYMEEGKEGVYLLINKKENKLYVILNDTIVYSFPVATGKNKNLTPEGEFKIVTKVKNPWYLPKNIAGGDPQNPLGTRWMGLNVPETGGYKYGIHGTNNNYSIGSHVSQGCVRMKNEDVEWLYRHIPLETRVIIG